jgi:hypothetical protein
MNAYWLPLSKVTVRRRVRARTLPSARSGEEELEGNRHGDRLVWQRNRSDEMAFRYGPSRFAGLRRLNT